MCTEKLCSGVENSSADGVKDVLFALQAVNQTFPCTCVYLYVFTVHIQCMQALHVHVHCRTLTFEANSLEWLERKDDT